MRNPARCISRRTARRVRRREAADQGAAETGEGGDVPELARGVRDPPRGDARTVERLEQVFESLDEKVRGKHCDGIAGIIEEGKSIMEEDFDEATMDACLIAAGQRAEHYEMAAYGTLVAWARGMGHTEAARLLQQNARRGESGRQEAVGARRGRHQSGGRRRGAPVGREDEDEDGARRPRAAARQPQWLNAQAEDRRPPARHTSAELADDMRMSFASKPARYLWPNTENQRRSV